MAKKASTKKPTRKKAPKKITGDDVTEQPRLPLPKVVSLGEVLGQPRAMSIMDRALNSGRVHHAWLMHGPVGVGKCTAALALAGVLLDPDAGPNLAGQFEADPQSRIGRLVRSGGHPELHVIRKELAAFHPDPEVRKKKQKVIPIDVIRHFLIDPALKTASMKGGLASKVLIVDEAELMSQPSQNAVLKTLEEPPAGTVLILVTSAEDRLLPTIRSRCQRVGFAPVDPSSMQQWVEASGLVIEPSEREWLLGFAAGAPGVVVSAHESRLYEWWKDLEPRLNAVAAGRSGGSLGTVMAGFVDHWSTEWAKGGEKGLEVRSKEVANRVGMQRMLSLVGYHAQLKLGEEASRGWAIGAVEAIGRAENLQSKQVQAGLALEGLAADLVSC